MQVLWIWQDRKQKSGAHNSKYKTQLQYVTSFDHFFWIFLNQWSHEQRKADLEMNEFDDVGISYIHLMQQAADQALDLSKVAQQAVFFF